MLLDLLAAILAPEGNVLLVMIGGTGTALFVLALGGVGDRDFPGWFRVPAFVSVGAGFLISLLLMFAYISPIIGPIVPRVEIPQPQNGRGADVLSILIGMAVLVVAYYGLAKARKSRPIEIKDAGKPISREFKWTAVVVPSGGSLGRKYSYLGIRIDSNCEGISARLVSIRFGQSELPSEILNLDEVNPTMDNLDLHRIRPNCIFRIARESGKNAFITFENHRESIDLTPGIYALEIEFFDVVVDDVKRVLATIIFGMSVKVVSRDRDGYDKKLEWTALG